MSNFNKTLGWPSMKSWLVHDGILVSWLILIAISLGSLVLNHRPTKFSSRFFSGSVTFHVLERFPPKIRVNWNLFATRTWWINVAFLAHFAVLELAFFGGMDIFLRFNQYQLSHLRKKLKLFGLYLWGNSIYIYIIYIYIYVYLSL